MRGARRVGDHGVYRDDGHAERGAACLGDDAAVLEYPAGWIATFEATLSPGIKGAAVEMCGTEGKLLITRSSFEFLSAEKGAQPVVVKAPKEQTVEHVANFLDCMKTRKLPNGDVWIGHRSAQASHLANIAYLQKRRLKFDPDREEILPL